MEKTLKIIDTLIPTTIFLGVLYVLLKLFSASEFSEKTFYEDVFLPSLITYILLVIRITIMNKKWKKS